MESSKQYQIDKRIVYLAYVLEVFKRYDKGATMTELRDWLNEQGVKNTRGNPITYNSIQHMLCNRRYIGEFAFRDTVIPDGIPSIVPNDLFERVQKKLEVNKKAPARHKAEDDYLLTTKIFCGYCGAYLCGESGTGRNGVYHYYKCVSVKKKRTECECKPVRKAWIENLVLDSIMELLADDRTIDAITSMVLAMQDQESMALPMYEQQLQEANTGINNLLNAIQQGILKKSTKSRLEELEAARDDLENKIALEKLSKPRISEEFVRFFLERFRNLDLSKLEHRKMLIEVFLNAVYVFNDKIVISCNYKDGTKTVNFSEMERDRGFFTGGSLHLAFRPGSDMRLAVGGVMSGNGKALAEARALADLLQGTLAAAKTAALMGHDGHDLLAAPIQLLQLGEDRHGEGAPPAGTADEHVVIVADIVQIAFQLRASLLPQLLLRLFDTGHVAGGILPHGLDLKQIAAHSLLDELSHDLGIALFQIL